MDHTLVATSPNAMIEAQRGLIAFCADKMAMVKKELAAAEAVFTSLQKAGLNTGNASRLLKSHNKRVGFYEKLRAALDAGYYIIPPLPLQTFAIRTKRDTPLAQHGTRNWTNELKPQILPVGEGTFVNPEPIREAVDSYDRKKNDGSTESVTLYENVSFADMDFPIPIKLVKPELIESVSKALQEKIFDSLGVLPNYRAADPIIGGTIKHWNGKSDVTFFVAWWLDTNDL